MPEANPKPKKVKKTKKLTTKKAPQVQNLGALVTQPNAVESEANSASASQPAPSLQPTPSGSSPSHSASRADSSSKQPSSSPQLSGSVVSGSGTSHSDSRCGPSSQQPVSSHEFSTRQDVSPQQSSTGSHIPSSSSPTVTPFLAEGAKIEGKIMQILKLTSAETRHYIGM